MSELNVQIKPKQKLQPTSSEQLQFSKKLAYFDIISWMILSIILLFLLIKEPTLGVYIQNIFAYTTTAYVSLRLGYTAKAGIENYQKIHSAYKELSAEQPQDNSNG